jgi:pimeloyl-[acyl-carrier protein] methyl ester esterase
MPHFVLMPGFDGTGELFAPLIDALGPAHSFTIIRYSDECSLAECVSTAISSLPEPRVVLIAESFSGPVALTLMSRFPDRIHCAVLSATFAASPHPFLLPLASQLPQVLMGKSALRGIGLRIFCLNGIRNAELVERATRVARNMKAAHVRARLRILRDVDLRSQLAGITTPTLYLRASHDRLIDGALGDDLGRGLPNAIVREIAGPHLLLQSKPVECAAAIHEFLERVPLGP